MLDHISRLMAQAVLARKAEWHTIERIEGVKRVARLLGQRDSLAPFAVVGAEVDVVERVGRDGGPAPQPALAHVGVDVAGDRLDARAAGV
jgi:hypothetical protein